MNINTPPRNPLAVLRARMHVPGVGRRIARHFNAEQVVCKIRPKAYLAAGTVVLNYGRGTMPLWWEEYNNAAEGTLTLLNIPAAVRMSSNKLNCLERLAMHNISALHPITSIEEAEQELEAQGKLIVRHILNGKRGKGLELLHRGDKVPVAPLYTPYYETTHEFRVHVFKGKVIDFVQKKRMGKKKLARYGLEAANLIARNHKQGWVFAHNDLICGDIADANGRYTIEDLGRRATKAVGLDMCAVDILAKFADNGKFIEAVVCETNSAPGMSATTTFKRYTQAITNLLEQRD